MSENQNLNQPNESPKIAYSLLNAIYERYSELSDLNGVNSYLMSYNSKGLKMMSHRSPRQQLTNKSYESYKANHEPSQESLSSSISESEIKIDLSPRKQTRMNRFFFRLT
jgi:hypothetical protein